MIFSDRGKNHRSRSQRTGRTPCSVFCALFCALFILNGCAGTSNEAQDSALVFIRDRDFASAVEMIKNDIDAGNDTEGMYRLLGIAQMGIGDYSAAAGSFETALDRAGMFPGDIDYDINYYLAACYVKMGRQEEAVDIYNAILEMKSGDADGYYLRGAAEMSVGNSEAAEADFSRVMEMTPTDYDRLIAIYETCVQYGSRDLGKSFVAAALERESGMSNYDRGRLSYYLEDYQTAKNCLESAKGDGSYQTTLLLGKTYEALGDMNYASDVYEGFLASDQTHPEIYNQLGLARLAMGDPQAALTAFQTGLKIRDNDIVQTLSFNEIVAYEYIGDFKKAQVLMEAYLKSYPEDENAKREQVFLSSR